MSDDSLGDDDAVTAHDIAEFLHHLADLRNGQPRADEPAKRVAFLTRKAQLFSRIAAKHARTDPDYATQVRQIALNARAAADQAALPLLPRQRVGPNPGRTPAPTPAPGGARSQENSGASSG